jgi:hypothetical protein
MHLLRAGPLALCGAYLAGCHQVPLGELSEPAAKLESRQHATPAGNKKTNKRPPAGDSIPDAAEIGLTPADS